MADELEADDRRAERLDAGLSRARRAGWADGRALALLGGALVPVGILLILIGWRGASRTPNLYDQVPYLISGAELGQTLAIVGALCYFAHWLTALVREQRAQGRAIVEALARVEAALTRDGAGPEPLVATPRGTLAHRPGCAAVAGKPALRPVPPDSPMPHCQLCLPTAS